MAEEGVWRTVRGHRVFIKPDGTIVSKNKTLDGKKLSEKDKNNSYKNDSYYKHLQKQLQDLDAKDKELHDNEPEQNKYDYSKPVDGLTEEDWKELSKTEKEMLIDMNREETKHDKWLKEVMSIDERRSDLLTKMKAIQNRAFEKEGGNTFKDKLPDKAKDGDYEGFSKDTNTYKQDYLEDIKYAKSKGYSEVYIAEMSPKEYMERCSKEIFEIPVEDVYSGMMNKADTDEYTKMMKSGVKFDMPYLDVKTKQQEGRHRALAAEKLGIKKIPVLFLK